ncbi:MAG: ParB/RepB/Spo0J family partition protein [Eubacterium sp.]|nr:ParB/RepB/Spo0J family partition protein [Eubacterium sp.]
MAARKVKNNVLGRGISALISEAAPIEEQRAEEAADPENTVRYIDINDIKPNRNQPRKNFDSEGISELAASIQEHGIIQPLIVRTSDRGYELVAGERRWRAAREAAVDKVPCIVREFTDEENALIAIIENMQREDLDPIEEAEGLDTMMKEYGLTQEEVSRSVGKSRPYITNSLRLLKLPQDIREKISEGAISAGHARALLSAKTKALQEQICQKIIKDGLSVRETEKLVKDGGKARKKAARSRKDPDIIAVEEKLKEIYGTRVAITTNGRKGAVEISYYGREDLNRIIELLESVK